MAFEMTYVALIFDLMIHNYFDNDHKGIADRFLMHMRTLGAVTVFFKWMKGFYWGKIFEGPAYFIV